MSEKLRYSHFAHRINIDAMVEALNLDLTEDGDELRGFCPLPWNAHKNGDTTGKFSINTRKRIYGCWVCGGGNLVDLVMALKDMDSMDDAIHWLYQFASHEETDEEFMEEFERLLADPAEQETPVPYFNTRVLDKWEPVVYEHEEYGTMLNSWVCLRGIEPEIAELFELRFNPDSTRKYKDDVYTGPSIYMPHMWRGRLVGWQQRWLDEEDIRPRWVPKYTMTPDFPKNTTLYGFDQVLTLFEEEGECPVVLVESVPSALFLWSHQQPAMATFGSSVSEDQMRLLRRFGHLILARDNDPAGIKWEQSLIDYLDRFTHVQVLPPVSDEPGADIGDLAEYPELLKTHIGRAYDSIDTVI